MTAVKWLRRSSILSLLPFSAPALINPNFTPVDLVEQSDQILVLELGPFGTGDTLPVRVVKAVQGDAPEKPPAIDLIKTDGPVAGPISATGWDEERCLGVWNVVAGTADAFLGKIEPGPLKLKWQFPGGKPQQKKIVVETKPMRVLLNAECGMATHWRVQKRRETKAGLMQDLLVSTAWTRRDGFMEGPNEA